MKHPADTGCFLSNLKTYAKLQNMKGTIIAGPMLNHGLKRLGKDNNGVYATNGQKKVYLTTENIKSIEVQRQGKKKLSLGKALLFYAFFGWVFAIIGAFSGKDGNSRVVITDVSGGRSLAEVDSKMLDELTTICF